MKQDDSCGEDIDAFRLEIREYYQKREEHFQWRFNNDEQFVQIPDFVLIKAELIELYKFWYTKLVDYELYSYAMIYHGREEAFTAWLSAMRCEQISTRLSEETIQSAITAVQNEFKSRRHWGFVHESDWDIFFNGTDGEREALLDRIHRSLIRRNKRHRKK